MAQIDARGIPLDQLIETDVCIIGAGAAGITLARDFRDAPFRVALLESGGMEFDGGPQSLNGGKNIGLPYFPLGATRLRLFGGTTNHWGGTCRPFADLDFEARDWVPYSGWPVRKSDLLPYYERAQGVCKVASPEWETAVWEKLSELYALPLNRDRVITRVAQIVPKWFRSFALLYRDEVLRAQNVTTYVNATVSSLETNEAGRTVTRVRIACLGGARFWLVAKIIVLAAGGIENARILLLSRSKHSNGLGNQYDLVGRFFMEHPRFVAGVFRPSDPQLSVGFYRYNRVAGIYFKSYLALPEAMQRAEKVQDVQVRMTPVYDASYTGAVNSEGIASLKRLAETFRDRDIPDDFGNHLKNVIADMDDVLVVGYWWMRTHDGTPPVQQVNLVTRIDPVPNPDSRVTLARERDPLDMNRIQLDWRLDAADKRSIVRSLDLIGREIGRSGLGRLQITLADDDTSWPNDLKGGWHHMGTTRMADTPEKGVVDRECKVHGISNLYIAGSSVFPTAGSGTPTLLIIALALRLAEHIKKSMSSV